MPDPLFIETLLAFVGVLTLFSLFLITNLAFLPKKVDIGVVLEKEFIPEHQNENLFSLILNGINPIISHYDDEWFLTVEFRNEIETFSVNKEFYDSMEVKSAIGIKYTISRFTKKINLVGINYFGIF